MKKNILQTFEEFLRCPISILKKTIINITGIESEVIGEKSISAQIMPDGNIQISVVNSTKAYKLLSSVVYKKQINELRQLINENKTGEISEKFTRPQIGTKV